MKKIAALISLFFSLHSGAQYFPTVSIPGTEVRKITSVNVQGQEYELQIMLPGGYKESSGKYPVVYLMDSQWDFPLLSAIYGQQYYDGFIPGLIIVGVTWGGFHPNPDSLRARDYTPTKENRLPQSGGADAFLSFMKNELFPFIESNYKADPQNRILMGCSLGGLFTVYTLFTQPELFSGYAAASPAIGWDHEVLRKYEKEFAKKKLDKRVRLYLTVGGVERGRPAFENFASLLKAGNYPGVSIQSKVLENTGHSGTKSETYTRGLQYIFERPSLKLTDAQLNQYVGKYTSSAGNSIEIKKSKDQLVLYFSAADAFPLFAATEKEFYSTAEFLNMEFSADAGTVNGFQLNLFGNSRYFSKSKN